MSIGALIFAQNNAQVDYVKMAEFAATKIKKHLSIPVTIVTDTATALSNNHPFGTVIEIDSLVESKKVFNNGVDDQTVLNWKNYARSDVYNLTPYDKTLVIDSDYIINSSVLKPALELNYDLQIYKNSFDLGNRNMSEFAYVNQYSIPFYWATTFIFQKSEAMESFFLLIQYIKQNWIYFKELYNLPSVMYRNDHAFSIAIHLMQDRSNGIFAVELPGKMSYILDTDLLLKIKDDSMQFLVQKANTNDYIPVKTTGIDVHVMNKFSLLKALA
jgi:hypothetical protein